MMSLNGVEFRRISVEYRLGWSSGGVFPFARHASHARVWRTLRAGSRTIREVHLGATAARQFYWMGWSVPLDSLEAVSMPCPKGDPAV